MYFFYLLNDVLCVFVWEPIFLHEILDKTQFSRLLIVQNGIILLAAHQLSQVLTSAPSIIFHDSLLCLHHFNAFAGWPSRQNGLFPGSSTLSLAPKRGYLILHVLKTIDLM